MTQTSDHVAEPSDKHSELWNIDQRLTRLELAVNAARDSSASEASANGPVRNLVVESHTFAFEARNLVQSLVDVGVAGRLDRLANETAETRMMLATMLSELRALATISIEARNHAFEGANIATHVSSQLSTDFNRHFNLEVPRALAQIHQAVAVITSTSPPHREAAPQVDPIVDLRPLLEPSFEQALELARQDFPTVYGHWLERLNTMQDAFATTIQGNAAHAGDLYSDLFRLFVSRHARGAVLDVGCGPLDMPYYLNGYPENLVCGLEPLPVTTAARFQRVRGISEYLPWLDAQFDTVISATALDHAISLDKALAEIKRVLKPGGSALLWIGSVPGAPPFAPLDPDFTPADKFHLFHIDCAWFEPMLTSNFEILERQSFDLVQHAHVFYRVRPKA